MAASLLRNDLVKSYRVHATHWLISTQVLGTQPIRFTHWMPGVPWSMMIFMYDETRKYMMRATSPEIVDAVTGAIKRQAGWIEKSTYY